MNTLEIARIAQAIEAMITVEINAAMADHYYSKHGGTKPDSVHTLRMVNRQELVRALENIAGD